MSVADFSVTKSDVKADLPFDTSRIGTGTEPISDSDIDDAIGDAAAEMAGVLERHSVEPADLSDNAERQIQNAVVDGAVAVLLRNTNHTGATYAEFRDRADELAQRYADQTALDRDGTDRAKLEEDQRSDDEKSEWQDPRFEM